MPELYMLSCSYCNSVKRGLQICWQKASGYKAGILSAKKKKKSYKTEIKGERGLLLWEERF